MPRTKRKPAPIFCVRLANFRKMVPGLQARKINGGLPGPTHLQLPPHETAPRSDRDRIPQVLVLFPLLLLLLRLPLVASSSALHDGAHTVCDLPATLRVPIKERARCLPHIKQDMVAPPNDAAAAKGEPDALDLYRRPSAITAVFASALAIGYTFFGCAHGAFYDGFGLLLGGEGHLQRRAAQTSMGVIHVLVQL